MAFDYDKLYAKQPDALGLPTPQILSFFEGLDGGPLRVLDVGCGQGRDALILGRLGHRVLGVDTSVAGIRDMKAAAAVQGLDVRGVVADILSFQPDQRFDVLLFDRILHMLNPDDRLVVLERLGQSLVPGGLVYIADEPSNMNAYKCILPEPSWKPISDKGAYLALRRQI